MKKITYYLLFASFLMFTIGNVIAQSTSRTLNDLFELKEIINIEQNNIFESYELENGTYFYNNKLLTASVDSNRYIFKIYDISNKKYKYYTYNFDKLLFYTDFENLEFIYNISFNDKFICLGIYQGVLILNLEESQVSLYDIILFKQDFDYSFLTKKYIYFSNFYRQPPFTNFSNNIIFRYDIKSKRIDKLVEYNDIKLEFRHFTPNKISDYYHDNFILMSPDQYKLLLFNSNLDLMDSVKIAKDYWFPYAGSAYFDSLERASVEYVQAKDIIYTMLDKFRKTSWVNHCMFLNKDLILTHYSHPDDSLKRADYYADLIRYDKKGFKLISENIFDRPFDHDDILTPDNFPINIAANSSRVFADRNILYILKLEGGIPEDWMNKSYQYFKETQDKNLLEDNFKLNLYIFELKDL